MTNLVGSFYEYMKVGIIHCALFPEVVNGEGPIEETIRLIAEDDYFQVIEVAWIKDDGVRKRVRTMLDISHMTCAYAGQPRLLTQGLNINSVNSRSREKAVATLKEGVDEAIGLGAKSFAFLSGNYLEEDKEQSYAALLESTLELCSYARQKGDLLIELEVFDYDIDKKSLIGPVDLAYRFARDVNKRVNNFGLMVDLSHLPLLRETPTESLVPIKEFITHAHIGNCVVKHPDLPGYGDQHPRFGFPGGENDVEQTREFLQVLLDIGFLNRQERPIVSFEVKPFADENPRLVVANAKRVLNEAWALVEL